MDRLSKFSDLVTREFIPDGNCNIDLSYRRLLRYLDSIIAIDERKFFQDIQLALELVEAFERNIIELSRIDRILETCTIIAN